MIAPKLSSDRLRRFKTEITDENRLISEAVARLMPADKGGIVLDVGAGLGDIAAAAFPQRRTVLIDILEFEPAADPLHQRQTIDFFDFRNTHGETIDVMLLSHVTQYIDDNLDVLVDTIRELNPANLIVVSNVPTALDAAIDRWFSERGLQHNAEQRFDTCPLPEYRQIDRVTLTSHLRCATFTELSAQLTSMIYDAYLTTEQVDEFSDWLRGHLSEPAIDIPQAATLYQKEPQIG